MGVFPAGRLEEALLEGTAESRLEEGAVAEQLDEAEAAIGLGFLQVVVLLIFTLSGSIADGSPGWLEGLPKAARICDIFGFSAITMRELKSRFVKR